MRAFVVVDLGFGDAGKGLVTDALVRETGARVVVRYNGGAQAGHNVVAPDGRHHTFAQLGAGTFAPGVRTVLGPEVAIHPTALLVEAEALRAKGVPAVLERLRVAEACPVITPFHQAANRLREIARGARGHGTCGVGVGEAVLDARARPAEAVRAADLRSVPVLREKTEAARARLRRELAGLAATDARAAAERAVLDRDDVLETWVERAAEVGRRGVVVPDEALAEWLADTPALVCEGAQGVLLDERHGFHPYTTWSRTTTEDAESLLARLVPGASVERVGVLRAHAVRHGPGPLPTETSDLRPAVREHNRHGPWQGPVRYGWFDGVLARHALRLTGGVSRLVVTHLDVPPRLGRWALCAGYEAPWTDEVLADEVARTESLAAARPRIAPCPPAEEAVVAAVEEAIGRPVDLVSRGPRAADLAKAPGPAARGWAA